MLNRLISFIKGSAADETPVTLYRQIVAQGRRPAFYLEHAVPDTLDGRFDMIVLHAFLTMRRLKRIAGPEAQVLSQRLFDLLFADMDSNLREIGVGDLGVGKRIKKMGQAFYGRVEAYEAGLAAAVPQALAEALRRNLYGTVQVPDGVPDAMADYLRRADEMLLTVSDSDVMTGKLAFPVI